MVTTGSGEVVMEHYLFIFKYFKIVLENGFCYRRIQDP